MPNNNEHVDQWLNENFEVGMLAWWKNFWEKLSPKERQQLAISWGLAFALGLAIGPQLLKLAVKAED